MADYHCHKCGAPWESDLRQPGFKEVCSSCGAYLHCCMNCRFHTPTAHNQCYIPNTEYVADRKGLNFCEEFAFREGPPKTQTGSQKQDKARQDFEGLFLDSADSKDQAEKLSFDDLFKE